MPLGRRPRTGRPPPIEGAHVLLRKAARGLRLTLGEACSALRRGSGAKATPSGCRRPADARRRSSCSGAARAMAGHRHSHLVPAVMLGLKLVAHERAVRFSAGVNNSSLRASRQVGSLPILGMFSPGRSIVLGPTRDNLFVRVASDAAGHERCLGTPIAVHCQDRKLAAVEIAPPADRLEASPGARRHMRCPDGLQPCVRTESRSPRQARPQFPCPS